jgi:hypothetical protein
MRNRIDLPRIGSAAGWLAAGALLCAPLCVSAGFAQAQSTAPNNVQSAGPGAAGLAPSGPQAPKPASATPQSPSATPPVLTLPPQPPPVGTQTGAQESNQAPEQLPTVRVPAQGPNAAATQAPNPPANQSASLPAAPDGKRGFLNDLGQWWDDSIANFNAKMKEQQAKLDEFNKQQSAAAKDATQAMKNAADAMFTPSKMIEVQQPCPVAGNGAPDCVSAAANVCKAKGFSDGHPMDIRTAERCKASLWVSGQAPTAADCPIETVLLRVACQP